MKLKKQMNSTLIENKRSTYNTRLQSKEQAEINQS